MTRAMPAFATVTLTAPALLAAGAMMGGGWLLAALVWMTALAAILDEAIAATLPTETDSGAEFPRADALSVALGLAQLGLIGLALAALTGATGLTGLEKAALFAGTGLFLGQVGNSNAHELIHRSRRGLYRLGIVLFSSVLYGHHASAHRLVHHVHVGTRGDPNSARWGEGFWRFLARAVPGEFRAGMRAETDRLRRAGRLSWRHPYLAYGGLGLAFVALSVWIGGAAGLIWYLALAGFAQLQIYLSDYVQHYGLRRQPMPDGRPEPVSPRHSWNAPHPFTSALMLNAPRHSDHHAHPARPYPALRLDEDMPTLPRSLPVMACLALWPGMWRRVMNPQVARWQAPAEHAKVPSQNPASLQG